jgi:hypothetical protein
VSCALGAAVWWSVSPGGAEHRAARVESSTTATVAKGADGVDSPSASERAGVERTWRAKLRCVDRHGVPRAFGSLQLAGPNRRPLEIVECGSDGEIELQLPEEFGSLWITGPLVFGEVARLEGRGEVLDYGDVRLRSRGTLRVEVVGLRTEGVERLSIGVRHPADTPGRPLGFGADVEAPVRAGRARAELIVEALRPLYVSISGAGIQRSFRDSQLEVQPGEVGVLTLDLGSLCELTGQVVGVLPRALEGRSIELLGVHALELEADAQLAESATGRAPRSTKAMRGRTNLDARGEFALEGLDRLPAQLVLNLGGARVPLVPRDPSVAAATPCDTLEIVLSPAEPVVAIALFDSGADTPAQTEVAMSTGGARLGLLHRALNGWLLVRRSELERTPPLTLFVRGRGWASLSDPMARVSADNVLRLAPADFGPHPGALFAEFSHAPSTDTRLVCRPVGASLPVFANDPDLDSATQVERKERRTVFSGLPSGSYALSWWRKGQLREAERVEHAAERTTRVRLQPPGVVRLNGTVRFDTDADTPNSAPGVVGVSFEGRRFAVNAGSFVYDGFEGPPSAAEIEFANGVRMAAVCDFEPHSDELVVSFAANSLQTLSVEPIFGGRLSAEPWPCGTSSSVPGIGGRYVSALENGRLCVAREGPGARGRVWEIGADFKVLRGWFDATKPSDATEFDGRHIELWFSVAGGPATVFAVAACDPLGAEIALAPTHASTTVWLPHSAQALRIEFGDGRSTTVEVRGTSVLVP